MNEDVARNAICPLIPRFEAVLKDARQLNLSLRRLKKAMKACDQCPEEGMCQAMADFNAMFSQAIQEVTEEWGITAY